jgi:hypothetical protein
MVLRYFWDNVYVQAHTQMIIKMFRIKSPPKDNKRRKSFISNSLSRVSSLTKDSDEDILEYFVKQVLQMKRDLFPLKHHLGRVLFEILKEKDSSKRTTLEDLRDLVQGQYYTIIPQGLQTFGVGSPGKDETNSGSQEQEGSLSGSL